MPAHIKAALTQSFDQRSRQQRPADARHMAGHLSLRAPRPAHRREVVLHLSP